MNTEIIWSLKLLLILAGEIVYPYHYGNTDITSLKETLKTDPETEVRIRQLQ